MNKNTLLTRGFTLIELLVVIAIIGILAAVVIGSLNDARSSGQDASIKQTMSNVRGQAEIIYNRGGAFSYAGVCADAQVLTLLEGAANGTGAGTTVITALATANQNIATAKSVACHVNANGTAYAISAPLTTVGTFWCVDSTGKSQQTSNVLAASADVCS